MPIAIPPKDNHATSKAAFASVPAVERAAAVLGYLHKTFDPSACTVTRIALALELHKSSCSNILRTLEAANLVEYDQYSKAYSLGVQLIGLGATAAKRRDVLQVGARPIEALVRETGLSCVTFMQLPNKNFLIIGGVYSPHEIKVTVDIGQQFPPETPTLARIAMSQMSEAEVDAFIGVYGLPKFSPKTKVSRVEIFRELELVRSQGYSISRGEYHAGNTAIGAPIFNAHDDVCRGICLVGFSSQIDEKNLPVLGQKLRDTANVITQAIGGQEKIRPRAIGSHSGQQE
jgi:DNA-binding IclR family transcriptional regulator